jgi:ATP-dependent exoDNAse (exonuclease V) alpha subunit
LKKNLNLLKRSTKLSPKPPKTPAPPSESPTKSKKPKKELVSSSDVRRAISTTRSRSDRQSERAGIPSDFELTREFSTAFDLLEHTKHHYYVTGNAGTGKSTLLHYFKEKTQKKTVVLAPTGIAAVNIGGSTIHSFFRFPTRLITLDDVKKIRGKADLFAALETLIIDEVSMVRADMMDAIDASLRLNRNRPYDPFGGVQLVLIGDLFQLPPVVERDLEEYFEDNYVTPYFFSAKVFSEIRLQKIELQHVFRQNDPEFILLLNKVRNKEIELSDLAKINQRHQPSLKFNTHDLAITLTSTNALASAINLQRLSALPSQEYDFDAVIEGDFDDKSHPTDKKLKLRKGAQVMMVKNDPNKRWVNGTLGVIQHISDDSIKVSFGSVVHTIEQTSWEKSVYEYDRTYRSIESIVTGSFRQYPIKLAWAITIHKSQGKTFDNVIINLGYGAFAHGQAYVALSRCRSYEGVYLNAPLKYSDIILDPRVRDFHM